MQVISREFVYCFRHCSEPSACYHRRRYGLLGPNGCGKSCLLKAISARELPIPDHIDIYHLGAHNHSLFFCAALHWDSAHAAIMQLSWMSKIVAEHIGDHSGCLMQSGRWRRRTRPLWRQ